jgi:hypothetical protein
MLVALVNAVKVESVPLNSIFFDGTGDGRLPGRRSISGNLLAEQLSDSDRGVVVVRGGDHLQTDRQAVGRNAGGHGQCG